LTSLASFRVDVLLSVLNPRLRSLRTPQLRCLRGSRPSLLGPRTTSRRHQSRTRARIRSKPHCRPKRLVAALRQSDIRGPHAAPSGSAWQMSPVVDVAQRKRLLEAVAFRSKAFSPWIAKQALCDHAHATTGFKIKPPMSRPRKSRTSGTRPRLPSILTAMFRRLNFPSPSATGPHYLRPTLLQSGDALRRRCTFRFLAPTSTRTPPPHCQFQQPLLAKGTVPLTLCLFEKQNSLSQ
jgi:hypothetical protein